MNKKDFGSWKSVIEEVKRYLDQSVDYFTVSSGPWTIIYDNGEDDMRNDGIQGESRQALIDKAVNAWNGVSADKGIDGLPLFNPNENGGE